MEKGSLFENLKKLHDNELYSNVISLATLTLSAYDTHRPVLIPQEHFYTLLYYGNALFHLRQYRHAETILQQVLQSKKVLQKTRGNDPAVDDLPDVEVKYKIALCLIELKQPKEAILMLQSLLSKQRTPKTNLLLARLCHHHGHERHAVSAYKEVLKECPLAMEAVEGLLELDMKGIEVNSLVVNAKLSPQCSDFVGSWIKAHALIYARKYVLAIQALRELESKSWIKNFHQLILLIGECYYHNDEDDNALAYLKRAHSLQSYHSNGLMLLAVLYAKKGKINELEKLILPSDIPTTEYASGNWFVMAQFLFSTSKLEKALYFASKACHLDPRNVEAALLKVKTYLKLNRYKDALTNLRMIQEFMPNRFEVHKGLVDTYLKMHRIREAQSMATYAIKIFGQTPRTLVLLARTYEKDLAMKFKTKALLEKALELDFNYLPAVFLLSEFLQDDGDVEGATKLLEQRALVQSNAKLRARIGDILSSDKDQHGALENYTIALNLDPSNRCAIAGLLAMGQPSSSTMDTSSYTANSTVNATANEEMAEFPQDNAFEMVENPANAESENETMWSDVEIEINNA